MLAIETLTRIIYDQQKDKGYNQQFKTADCKVVDYARLYLVKPQ